ncbi:putative hydroxyisourate hydrolase, 2-oxo-4-hydroxy-4-carboxy-5-ureidoimidazoline decarboxylase [Lupinus albus]|uniref:Putative hydroxyisourate hydrolase, 2-oxo-4-hydroxy-4-carboxy-5-ureidoimidazoline decarboxylase n=1 Tax=Lupinus albus TaxID=3870 RepID=A0A6A4QC18_LUPAL|nr:putative hydroxyisourate hydrolase, 2-oxo-4-hydroxy-4-carboxy-5-ureidoimidazoline decarboxylase [Lupinus albus]
MEYSFDEKDYVSCCGSTRFGKEMVLASPFSSLQQSISIARHIWFNNVDVNAWLQAFSSHPQIGQSHSPSLASQTSAQWSKGEQSTALATATGSSLQELSEWNAKYMNKFGFVFLICASGRSTDEILAELKKRYTNRPIVEFEIAAQEQMKITELRLAKLFSSKENISSTTDKDFVAVSKKAEDRISIIGGHVTSDSTNSPGKSIQLPSRTRPPITTHVLDVSRGAPAAGIEVLLEAWRGTQPRPTFGIADGGSWIVQGSSTTDSDGRSGQLLSIVDDVNPGIYRISFNTGKYNPNGFFPYVSIVFEILESQKKQHFHVPLLLSPFSFSTYRGS